MSLPRCRAVLLSSTACLFGSAALLSGCAEPDPAKSGARDTAEPNDTAKPDDTAEPGDSADTADSGDPALVPNAGDVPSSIGIDTEDRSSSIAAVEDLDGDGLDEVVLTWQSRAAAVVRPAAGTASSEIDWVEGQYQEVWAAGNGQLVVEDEAGYAAIRLTSGNAGWEVSERVEVGTTWCAAPTGDLDGDGNTDVLVQGSSEVLQVVRGPIVDGYEVIAEVQDWSRSSALTCGAAAGDVDGDGADDLLWVEPDDNFLRIAFGPLRAGKHTVDSLPDLQVDLGQSLGHSRVLVSHDLDSDGAAEVVVFTTLEVLGFDGVDRNTSTAVPEWTIDQAGRWGVSRRGEGLLVIGTEEAGWWYSAPRASEPRPPAAAKFPYNGTMAVGRFGSGSGLDLAWVKHTSLYVVPGAGAVGTDLDRDGGAAPEDCDDGDAAVRVDAPELSDGVDNDCDGAVDEPAPVDLPPAVAHTGDRNASLASAGLVVWPGPDGAHAVFSTQLGERAWVATLLADDAEALPTSSQVAALTQAGDMDGDGHADLAALLIPSHAELIRGPAPGASAATIDLSLDEAWFLAPVGDLDADGHDDLFAGGGHYESDRGFVQSSAWVPGQDLVGQVVEGPDALEAVGPVDLNDDGYDDLLLVDGDASFWLGPITSADDITAGSVSGRFSGVPSLLQAGDLDADGVSDLVGGDDDGLVVAHGPWTAGTWAFDAEVDARRLSAPVSVVASGSEWLFVTTNSDDWQSQILGYALPLLGEGTADEAAVRVLANQPRAHAGYRLVIADLDGDGGEELVVASPGEAAPADDEGVLRVYALP